MSWTTPLALIDTGEAWFELGRDLTIRTKPNLMIAKWVCLCFALEFYLKAYIVLKDKTFADNQKLKSLSHSFVKMNNKINTDGTKVLSNKVRSVLRKYGVADPFFDFTVLRYPLVGRSTPFDKILMSSVADFEKLFDEITQVVNTGWKKWK